MVSSLPSRALGRTRLAAASDERATSPRSSPSPAALHCWCREVRVLGLKKTVGAEVFDLVLVERNEHLMEIVEAIRAPDDLRQSAHQRALSLDWEASRASNLDEDPGRLGLHGPFLAARDLEHRRVTDILIGHLVDVHAFVGHLVRLVEDVQRSLDQLLLGFPCESRRTQDGDYGHGFFSFTRGRRRGYLPQAPVSSLSLSRCGRTLSGRPQTDPAPPSPRSGRRARTRSSARCSRRLARRSAEWGGRYRAGRPPPPAAR